VHDTGLHQVYVRVFDSAGVMSAAASFSVTVKLYAPVIAALRDTFVAINDTICFHTQAHDTNGTIIRYQWSFDFGATWIDGRQTLCRKAISFDTVAWKVLVRAVDDDSIVSVPTYFTVKIRLYAPRVSAMKGTSVNINDSVTITAAGYDSNGVVVKYLWSRNTSTYSDTTITGNFTIAWVDSGIKTILVRAIDNDGVLSEPDSCQVKVSYDPPMLLTRMSDTTVHQYDTIKFTPSARDANSSGSIVSYLLDRGADGWDDSISGSSLFTIVHPAGGTIKVIWGARDDDGIVTADTFLVRFNRPPTNASVVVLSSTTAWKNYSYVAGTGDLSLTLLGNDPDGPSDTLTYHVVLARVGEPTFTNLYTGQGTVITAAGLDTNTMYAWRVTTKDLFGDNRLDSGVFTTPGAPAWLDTGTTTLFTSCVLNSDASNDTFYVWNIGSGSLDFTVNDTSPWLSCSPKNGTLTGPGNKQAITVTYATKTLSLGTYHATIDVAAEGVHKKVSVTMLVTNGPFLVVSDSVITSTCIEGINPDSGSFTVSNGGAGSFTYTISDNVAWLSCRPDTGTITGSTPKRIGVDYAVSSLSPGTYMSTITVSSPGLGLKLINVKLTVLNQPAPEVSKTVLSAVSMHGSNAASDSFLVWNSGAGTLHFTVSDTMSWVTCTPNEGTSTGVNDKKKIIVAYSTDTLSNGTRNGAIEVTSVSNRGDTLRRVLAVNDSVRQNWYQTVENAPFGKRCAHTSVVFDNKIWVIGGYGESEYADVWYFDGASWKLVTSQAEFGLRYGHSSVVFENRLWVIGGNFSKNDVWNSIDGITWNQVTSAAAFSGRSGHTSVVFDNKMWVIGGGYNKNDVWYSTDGVAWTQATSSAGFKGRWEHSSAVFDGKIWVLGGHQADEYYSDIWYSQDGSLWTQVTSVAPFNRRCAQTSAVFDNKLWIVGGFFSQSNSLFQLNDVWYSIDGMKWTLATATAGFSVRHDHSSVIFDNKFWVIGGSYYKSDVWYTENK
jgi:hypothetical protein